MSTWPWARVGATAESTDWSTQYVAPTRLECMAWQSVQGWQLSQLVHEHAQRYNPYAGDCRERHCSGTA